MVCKSCGEPLKSGNSICPRCGKSVNGAQASGGMRHCPKCGKKLAADAKSCSICGSVLPPLNSESVKKSKSKSTEVRRCPNCGVRLEDEETICGVCGHRLVTAKKVTISKVADYKLYEQSGGDDEEYAKKISLPLVSPEDGVSKSDSFVNPPRMPEPQPNDNRTRMSAPQPNFQAQMTVCRKCGAQFPSNSVYCPMCGVSTLLGTSTLEVNIESKIVHDKAFKKKTLLKDINAEIKSGDFVLILGGSGAGKSTFIKAVLGESKANGKIVLDGQDLYKNFKKLKSQIGVVPQHSILRDEDSVKNTIYDAARIKLSDSSPSQIEKEVSEVMKRLGLDSIQNNLIRNISGGQMKKVAVATQLIGDQKVFVFDEPDSGLDVASRKQQMNILKDIADNDKTVLVITHAPDDAIDLFTKVLVLAKSTADGAGHVAYFGDVKNALGYFGTNKLQDIVIELNPKAEGGHGRSDEFIEKYRRTPQFTGR